MVRIGYRQHCMFNRYGRISEFPLFLHTTSTGIPFGEKEMSKGVDRVCRKSGDRCRLQAT